MGTYNLKEFVEKISKFRENKCPICDNDVVIDNNYEVKVDCIHYTCDVCSPDGCVISISGSVLASDNFTKILTDKITKDFISIKIRTCKNGEVKIMMSDFR